MSLCVGRAKCGAVARKIVRACLWWCCVAATVETRAWGQTAVDGAISGFVVDAGGAALVGAVVRVENVVDGRMAGGRREGKGELLVARLPAGECRVEVEYALFSGLTLQPVVVEVGGVTSVEARMRVGGVATSVTVKADPVPPSAVSVDELSSAAVGSVVTPDEIERLPVNGRRWQTFALVVPTVNADPEGDGLLSFRGVASTQNSSRIDGGDDDQSFGSVPRGTGIESGAEIEDAAEVGVSSRIAVGSASGGGGYGRPSGMAYTFSRGAGRGVRVSGQNYSALYGHAAGGVITTGSKSGANERQGTGFYLLRTRALDAARPLSS